ncbi:Nucleoporin nup49/NSP49 (Nuclear pore protein nup49/NSP49) [Rhodotorula sphaerocarpa]
MSLFGGASSAPTFSFGATTSAPTTQPGTQAQAPSLFGQPAAGGAAGGGGGGLFGAAAKPPTSTSAPGTSLFGGGAPATTPAAPGGGGGGLFGGASAAPKPTFSFGAPSAQPGQAQPAAAGGGGGLFGSTTTTGATGGGGGLFGAAQPQQQAGGGLFGSTTTMGAAAPSASFAPGASTSSGMGSAGPASGITKASKFNDLPDAARNAVEEIDKFIRGQCQLGDQLKAKDLGGEIVQTQRLYEQYSAEASTVTSALQADARLLATLRAELEQSLADLTKTTLLIEGYQAGPGSQKAQEARVVSQFPYEYFRRKADEMKDRVRRYRATMDQIASLLSSPSHALSPTALVPTLKAQHASLVSLASSVSALDLELKQLKDRYREIWREKTGRVVDPFRLQGGGGSGVGIERNLRGIELR